MIQPLQPRGKEAKQDSQPTSVGKKREGKKKIEAVLAEKGKGKRGTAGRGDSTRKAGGKRALIHWTGKKRRKREEAVCIQKGREDTSWRMSYRGKEPRTVALTKRQEREKGKEGKGPECFIDNAAEKERKGKEKHVQSLADAKRNGKKRACRTRSAKAGSGREKRGRRRLHGMFNAIIRRGEEENQVFRSASAITQKRERGPGSRE